MRAFKKGDPRINRKGPPTIVKDIREFIRAKLHEPASKESDRTKLEVITAKLLSMAYSGNMRAVELAMAYGYGKPTESIEIAGAGGKQLFQPLVVNFKMLPDAKRKSNKALEKEIRGLKNGKDG